MLKILQKIHCLSHGPLSFIPHQIFTVLCSVSLCFPRFGSLLLAGETPRARGLGLFLPSALACPRSLHSWTELVAWQGWEFQVFGLVGGLLMWLLGPGESGAWWVFRKPCEYRAGPVCTQHGARILPAVPWGQGYTAGLSMRWAGGSRCEGDTCKLLMSGELSCSG